MTTFAAAQAILEQHHVTPAVIVCDECDDYGFVYADIPVGHWAFGKMFPCPLCDKGKAIKQQRVDSVFSSAGIPERYKEFTLKSFLSIPEGYKKGKWLGYAAALTLSGGQHDKAAPNGKYTLLQAYEAIGITVEAGKQYDLDLTDTEYNTARNWTVLHGANGTGKTGLSAALALALSKKGVSVLFLRVQEYLEAVRQSYNADAQIQTRAVVEAAQKVDFLILDEFFEPNLTSHSISRMEELVRYRYNHHLPLWATTNFNVQQFKACWGAQIGSVMADAHWIPHSGIPIRQETTGGIKSL